jgi:hypothetical protein
LIERKRQRTAGGLRELDSNGMLPMLDEPEICRLVNPVNPLRSIPIARNCPPNKITKMRRENQTGTFESEFESDFDRSKQTVVKYEILARTNVRANRFLFRVTPKIRATLSDQFF